MIFMSNIQIWNVKPFILLTVDKFTWGWKSSTLSIYIIIHIIFFSALVITQGMHTQPTGTWNLKLISISIILKVVLTPASFANRDYRKETFEDFFVPDNNVELYKGK